MQEEYDDYEDDDYNYDNDQADKYKFYFKFDPNAWDAWGKWLSDAMKDIVADNPGVWYTTHNIHDFPFKKFPVNSYFSNTGKDHKSYQYLGNNYDGVAVWKKKYFINDPIQSEYIDHIANHAAYFIKQPHYYKGMFDILN